MEGAECYGLEDTGVRLWKGCELFIKVPVAYG